MKQPEKLKKPTSPMSPEVKNILKVILSDLEIRRQLLSKKIPLSQLECPVKFIIK